MAKEEGKQFKCKIHFGSVEIKQFKKFENGRMFSYSYVVNRDLNGIETSRTEPFSCGSIGYDSGSDFTEEDYERIKNWRPEKRKGFFARLADLLQV